MVNGWLVTGDRSNANATPRNTPGQVLIHLFRLIF